MLALKSILAISLGASFGALLRWQLSERLQGICQTFFPQISVGMLVANWLGAYLVGLAIAYFGQKTDVSPEWRLFIVTGFCGALTTFSSFSVEIVAFLQSGKLQTAAMSVALHLFGSLAFTVLGLISFFLFKKVSF